MATTRIRQKDLIDRLDERASAIELMRESEAILKLLYTDEQGLHVDRNTTQRAMRILGNHAYRCRQRPWPSTL